MSHRKDVIRVGDRVRIVVPSVVLRVGYPKAVSDYETEVRERYGSDVARLLRAVSAGAPTEGIFSRSSDAELLKGKSARRIIGQLAWEAAHADCFGGRARTLHTVEVQDLAGAEGRVSSVRTAKTGTYCGGGSWLAEDDYEPAGLRNEETHRIATVEGSSSHFFGHSSTHSFLVQHLEKIP